MKRYLTGLLALVFAFTAFAFTTKPKKMINGKEVASSSDPCLTQNMKWFLMKLDCADQISFSDLVGTGNYTMTTQEVVANSCDGSSCVCAIIACTASNGTSPVISSGTSIYNALWNFFQFGQTSGLIITKDDFAQSRRQP